MTDPIDRVTMIDGRPGSLRPVRLAAARSGRVDRVLVYWAVGSFLLVFLALILSLVVSGKLRALTAAVDRQTAEIESLHARVRELENRATAGSRPITETQPSIQP